MVRTGQKGPNQEAAVTRSHVRILPRTPDPSQLLRKSKALLSVLLFFVAVHSWVGCWPKLELRTLFFFLLFFQVLGQGGCGVTIWDMWTRRPREPRQLDPQGWGWPQSPGLLGPPCGWGGVGPRDITGTLGSMLPLLHLHCLCSLVLFWLLNFSFRDTVARWASSCFYCPDSCHLATSL